jgi:hypothetical protein
MACTGHSDLPEYLIIDFGEQDQVNVILLERSGVLLERQFLEPLANFARLAPPSQLNGLRPVMSASLGRDRFQVKA